MSEKINIVDLSNEEDQIIFPRTHASGVFIDGVSGITDLQTWISKNPSGPSGGTGNLSEIQKAISELQDQVFPLSSTLKVSGNKTIFEFLNRSLESDFINTISYKNEEIDRSNISSFILDTSSGIADVEDLSDFPKEIHFYLPIPTNFSGVKDYSATLTVSLKDNRQTTSSCSFKLIAPSWIGWSSYSEVGTWLNDLSSYVTSGQMFKKVSTNISGTYTWEEVGAGNYFWIIVPDNSDKFSGYSMVMGNNFPATMIDKGTTLINGVSYRCYRNTSDKPTGVATKWTMVLSND